MKHVYTAEVDGYSSLLEFVRSMYVFCRLFTNSIVTYVGEQTRLVDKKSRIMFRDIVFEYCVILNDNDIRRFFDE